MSALFSKKKSYKFEIIVDLEELNSVPFRNAVLFAKLRLINSRHSSQYSERVGVQNNRVPWLSKHVFQCKMFANPTNSILEPQELKISIRREVKGGKSYHKVGYVTINLACFSAMGGGPVRRRYILEAYNQQKRQDNSMLHVSLTVKLILGDTCFRVPPEDKSRYIPYDTDMEPSSIHTDFSTTNQKLMSIDQSADEQDDSAANDGTSSETASSNHPSLNRHQSYQLEMDMAEEQDTVPATITSSPFDNAVPSAISPIRGDIHCLDSATWPMCKQCGHIRTSHAELELNQCPPEATSPGNAPPKLIPDMNSHHITNHSYTSHHHGASSRTPNSSTSHQMMLLHCATERGHQRNPSSVSSIQSGERSSAFCSHCMTGMSMGFGGPATSSSGYRTHSRNSSLDSAYQFNKLELQVKRGGSSISCSSNSINSSLDRMRDRRIISHEEEQPKQYQIDSTRIDNAQIVNEILRSKAPAEKILNQPNTAKLTQHNQALQHRPNSLGANAPPSFSLPEKG